MIGKKKDGTLVETCRQGPELEEVMEGEWMAVFRDKGSLYILVCLFMV